MYRFSFFTARAFFTVLKHLGVIRMKKTLKLAALCAGAAMILSILFGMPTSAEETKTYSFDELMEMSLEELETEAGFTGISESIERIAAQPPMEIQARQLKYYILLKDYENVIPTLYETITGVDQDGNAYTLDVVSRKKTAALLGLPEKLINPSIYTVGLNDFGSIVIEPLGLSEAEILEVSILFNAYGEDNINKTYCLVTRILQSGQNENILNIRREGNIGGYSVGMPGDATCDNSIDVCDAVLIARFLAEDSEASMTDHGRRNADYNADGDITQDDVVLILQKIARLI